MFNFKYGKNPLIAAILIATQICPMLLTRSALADPTASPDSAEMQLMTRSIELSGEKLPQSELQNQLLAAIAHYEKTAPIEGREGRLMDTMVTMNLVDSSRAATLRQTLDESIQEQTTRDPGAGEANVVAIAVQTALASSQGAQYTESAGELGLCVGGLVLTSIMTIATGYMAIQGAHVDTSNAAVSGSIGSVGGSYQQQSSTYHLSSGVIAAIILGIIAIGGTTAGLCAAYVS